MRLQTETSPIAVCMLLLTALQCRGDSRGMESPGSDLCSSAFKKKSSKLKNTRVDTHLAPLQLIKRFKSTISLLITPSLLTIHCFIKYTRRTNIIIFLKQRGEKHSELAIQSSCICDFTRDIHFTLE